MFDVADCFCAVHFRFIHVLSPLSSFPRSYSLWLQLANVSDLLYGGRSPGF